MWIVENKNKYISGVFKDTKKLNKYLAEVRKANKDNNQVTYMAGGKDYPLFILENDSLPSRFTVFTDKALAEKTYKDLGLKWATIYTINKDYTPDVPGNDFMGILSHDHLGEDE